MRKKIVAGNWKMNGDPESAKSFFQDLKKEFNGDNPLPEVGIAVPFPLVSLVFEITPSFSKVGAQNCYPEEKGAYTGEVSPVLLKKCGCSFVILGHSERRTLLGEKDAFILEKSRMAISSGLEVIYCLGETLEERESGAAEKVIERQLRDGVFQLEAGQIDSLSLAYEPVWAIGTGKSATTEQAGKMHAFIRKKIKERFGPEVGDKIRIIYGGSCNKSNAAELFSHPDIDGGLIGGASLMARDFAAIINAAC